MSDLKRIINETPNSISIKAHAKLNLFLDILGKRQDGFHEVDFINCNLAMHDIITIEKIKKEEIIITSDNPKVPLDEKNFCHKIVSIIKEKYNLCGIKIHIEKNIPFIGGLGGGSADAAATLIGLNQLFSLNLSDKEMIEIIKPITSDGCYCVVGGLCRVKGIGEKVEKLIFNIPKFNIILIQPEIKLPDKKTQWMYSNYDNMIKKELGDIKKMISALSEGNQGQFFSSIYNTFTQLPVSEYDVSRELILNLERLGCKKASLCGSGPTVFGICDDVTILNKIQNKFPNISSITSTL